VLELQSQSPTAAKLKSAAEFVPNTIVWLLPISRANMAKVTITIWQQQKDRKAWIRPSTTKSTAKDPNIRIVISHSRESVPKEGVVGSTLVSFLIKAWKINRLFIK
jgi:hypothetical protein